MQFNGIQESSKFCKGLQSTARFKTIDGIFLLKILVLRPIAITKFDFTHRDLLECLILLKDAIKLCQPVNFVELTKFQVKWIQNVNIYMV